VTSSTPVLRLPTKLAGMSQVASLALVALHSCLLKVDGTVWCWGNNDTGQLGNGTTASRTIPGQVVFP
jgi:alpha-tubulin suppressor-like RCC1 family protein